MNLRGDHAGADTDDRARGAQGDHLGRGLDLRRESGRASLGGAAAGAARRPGIDSVALYRHFDADGRLLYVGISRSVTARLTQHSESPWDHLIARIEVERFPTREEAEAAERAAIRSERPIHNRTHNTDPTTVVKVLLTLGRSKVRKRLGLSHSDITDAIAASRFPARWYGPMRELAEAKGFDLPLDAFHWRAGGAPARPDNRGAA